MVRFGLLLLSFLVSTTFLEAQNRRSKDIKTGFIAGFVYAEVMGENENSKWNDYGAGVYAGTFADIYITDKIHLQPAINYAYVNDFSILYFPLMVKYHIGDKGFNVQAGPKATFLIDRDTGTKDQFGWELGGGVGMDITKSFFVEARYTYEISRRKVDDFLGQPSQDFKFNNVIIGIGYRLSPVDRL